MSITEGYELRTFIVCLVDILGQKAKLAAWPPLPIDGKPDEKLYRAVGETLGIVIKFRERFAQFYKEADVCTVPELLAQCTPQQKAEYERFSQCRIETQQFSDLCVMYAPLENAFGDLSAIQVHRMLGACAVAMLTWLTEGIAIRGGITIGDGTEVEKSNFYGPALAEAYHLESRLALWPRVLVSQQVCDFLRHLCATPRSSTVGRMMAGVARECQRLICQDADGLWMVDFMGHAIRQCLKPNRRIRPAIQSLLAFVCSEERRFRELKDEKLAARYAHLLGYVEARLPLWSE